MDDFENRQQADTLEAQTQAREDNAAEPAQADSTACAQPEDSTPVEAPAADPFAIYASAQTQQAAPISQDGYENDARQTFPHDLQAPAVQPYAASEPIVPSAAEVPVMDASAPAQKTPNKGLRLFVGLLAAVLLLSAAIIVGYFVGIAHGGSGTNTYLAGLESKPSDQALEENPISSLYYECRESIVGIQVYNTQSGKYVNASGVIYSQDGYIVTNDHIYANIAAPSFLVRLSDGSTYEGTFVAGDSRSDLAVLKIDATGLKPAVFGNSEELLIGEEVLTIGYPGGNEEDAALTRGTISSKGRRVNNQSNYSTKLLQTDAAINPGSSGGALLNVYGQVVGITSFKLTGDNYDRVGFAIPTSVMKPVVDSLLQNGYVAGRARLGITYQMLDQITAPAQDLPQGIYIASVSEDSDLSSKGVGKGDVITQIDNAAVQSSNMVLDIIENAAPGSQLTLTVYLAEEKNTVVVQATLLEDRGTSSYKTTDNEWDNDNSSDNNEFTFPFGE